MLKYKFCLTSKEKETLLDWVKTEERNAKVIQEAQDLLSRDRTTGSGSEGKLAHR